MTLDLTRQSDIIPERKAVECKVTIVGAGAIGSHVAECLAKIGIREMQLWDFDLVESHNVSNQGYRLGDIGKAKVSALKERLEVDTGISVDAVEKEFTNNSELSSSIVISAVDSMKGRKSIFNSMRVNTDVMLFIDARMGALYGEIYSINLANPHSLKEYEQTLFDDSEGYQEPCTRKATIFCAQGMAAWIASVVADYLSGEEVFKKIEVDFARKTANGIE